MLYGSFYVRAVDNICYLALICSAAEHIQIFWADLIQVATFGVNLVCQYSSKAISRNICDNTNTAILSFLRQKKELNCQAAPRSTVMPFFRGGESDPFFN